MLNLFFSTSFWYDVLAIIAIIAVIAILIKYPHAKIYVFTILFALITISGIYSIVNINSYYSASGGIYGILTGSFGDNNKLYVNEKTFELKNTTLTQVHDDTYHAKSISDDVFVVNTNEYLGVFVNGSPCTYSKIEEDYFVAYYTYNFYGKDDEVLFSDTLKMYFAFYEKSTQLEVLTDGGSEAVQYWNYYFNNNDFKVTLKSVKTTYDKELALGTGDISNYVVVKYYLDETEVAKQVCLKGSTIEFPTLNDGKYYKWKLKDNEDYLDSSYVVTQNLSLYGEETEDVFVETEYVFVEKTWNGLNKFYGGNVWTDGENIYYSSGATHYILNQKTSTWEEKTWNGGPTSFFSSHLWSDNENIYYSNGVDQYVLNRKTLSWTTKTWNGLSDDLYLFGFYIWTDGENIYYSNGKSIQYVLNKETLTWEEKIWNGSTNVYGDDIWTDGENIYRSFGATHYILNKDTSTWEEKIWNGVDDRYFTSGNVWTDGENIYYSFSDAQLILNKETSTWEEKIWNGFSDFKGGGFWTDGENIYYSKESNQYILVQKEL